jgi:hypothetical protein
MVGAAGRNDRISLCTVIVVFPYLTFTLPDVSRCARDGAKDLAVTARVKREEAKQGLSLHDVGMNGLASRGVIRMQDADCASTVPRRSGRRCYSTPSE